MKILVTRALPNWAKNEIEVLGHELVTVAPDAYVNEQLFCEGIKGFDVYVSGGLEDCTAPVIEAADKLKAIIFLGVDYKAYIDADAASRKNIPIFNTPGANARAVAELTFFLILAAARKAGKMVTDTSQQIWKIQTGFELAGKTLGLLGSGAIAKQVATIGQAFGMNVIYWSRSGAKTEMPGKFTELDAVFAKSDILSLHIPKDAGQVLDKSGIGKMKQGAILINAAPASLVDPDALYDALKDNRLYAAAFDPFYTEGEGAWKCAESKLLDLGPDKFFITPHAGWATNEADDNMIKMAIERIKEL